MTTAGTELRLAQIHAGDSLRRLALRELGDALRWIELATVNQLRPPYIVESTDPDDRLPGTRVWGDTLYVPIGTMSAAIQAPQEVLGIDLALCHGQLDTTEGGDYAPIVAHDNLNQALQHRVKTPLGDLLGHPGYGCQVSRALGLRLRPVAHVMVAGFVRQSILTDPRVTSVRLVPPEVNVAVGDALQVTARVQSVVRNTYTDINFVFPWLAVI